MAERASVRARWGCLAACTCLLHGSSLVGQQVASFRSTVELIRVHAAVFARYGGPVADLEADDFTLVVDGAERPIAVFLGPRSGPLEVAVAMDVSRSMSFWDSRKVFHALLDGLDPGSCVLLLPFAEEVRRGYWAHPENAELRALIDEIPQAGESEAAYAAPVRTGPQGQ